MSFTLEKVVPWGRSFEEYVAMFSLSTADLKKKILGCGDGPSSFNAILTAQGGSVVSVDPIYMFSVAQIRKRIDVTYKKVINQTRLNKREFVCKSIKTVEELGSVRMAAMEKFLTDYSTNSKRYVAGKLPDLPFEEDISI